MMRDFAQPSEFSLGHYFNDNSKARIVQRGHVGFNIDLPRGILPNVEDEPLDRLVLCDLLPRIYRGLGNNVFDPDFFSGDRFKKADPEKCNAFCEHTAFGLEPATIKI